MPDIGDLIIHCGDQTLWQKLLSHWRTNVAIFAGCHCECIKSPSNNYCLQNTWDSVTCRCNIWLPAPSFLPLPPFNVGSLQHYRHHAQIIAQQHWKGRGYLGELAAFLWEEAILTLQEWIFGKGVSTTLQVTCIYVMKEILTFGGGLNFCELQWCTNHFNHH